MNTRQGIVGAFKLAQAVVTPSSEMSEKRLKLCLSCDDIDVTKADIQMEQCRNCGCFVRQKVKLVNEQCPIGKW